MLYQLSYLSETLVGKELRADGDVGITMPIRWTRCSEFGEVVQEAANRIALWYQPGYSPGKWAKRVNPVAHSPKPDRPAGRVAKKFGHLRCRAVFILIGDPN